MTESLNLAQFDYDLPDELIAQHPANKRNASRLLYLDSNSALHDKQFIDLPELLRPNDLLVFNDTKVIKARLFGKKITGGQIELLVERILPNNQVLAHIKASKAPKTGTELIMSDGAFNAEVLGRVDELFKLAFPHQVLDLLDQYGHTPLPPYINHAAATQDDKRYQTVYASHPGAVAAPTAGLHFDETMLAKLTDMGVSSSFVTLHVGAGTFQPVRVANIKDHIMHAERYVVSDETMQKIHQTRALGGRVIAVGTTSVRSLEAAAHEGDGIHGHQGDTRIFITPGYKFINVDALITNFHLPQSTLLMLISALAGMDPIKKAYAHAVQSRYRFFSYGDAMFIETPKAQ